MLVVLVLPAALTWRVEADAIPFIVASGALELVYFAMLAAAYRRYELSLVYPVARGLAPVLALLIVVAAGGALPAALGVVGVLAVSAGVLLVRGPRGDLHGLAVGAAIAAIIGGYTVVDRYGIQHAAAGPYLLLIMIGPAIVYPLAIGRRRLRAAAGWQPFAIGAGLSVAYLLVLLALRIASAPAVSAVRETSVVIATAAGGRLPPRARLPRPARRLGAGRRRRGAAGAS